MVGLTHGLDQVQRLRVVGHHHNTLARLMEGRCKGTTTTSVPKLLSSVC